MKNKKYYTYIMTNKNNTTLYTGVTNNIQRRTNEHWNKENPRSFTAKYNVCKLVHWESFDEVTKAISREKQIKKWLRKKKIDLIMENNPGWEDLSDYLI